MPRSDYLATCYLLLVSSIRSGRRVFRETKENKHLLDQMGPSGTVQHNVIHTVHICMHRQKIIISAAELAVRPPICPCWKLSYLVSKVPKKVQVHVLRNQKDLDYVRTCSLALLPAIYLTRPDPSSIPKR